MCLPHILLNNQKHFLSHNEVTWLGLSWLTSSSFTLSQISGALDEFFLPYHIISTKTSADVDLPFHLSPFQM